MISLGFGTYRTPLSVLGSLLNRAVDTGIHHIDTASNYLNGKAHEGIQNSLNKRFPHIPTLSTKIGFIPPSDRKKLREENIISQREAELGHSIRVSYLRYQINIIQKTLSPLRIHTLFLHNPEVQAKEQGPQAFLTQLKEAFKFLETLTEESIIQSYGISTWTGFGHPHHAALYSVASLVEIAKSITPHHHFSAIQLPLSLSHRHFIQEALFSYKGPLIEAKECAVRIFASAPLGGGNLPKALNASFCEKLGKNLTPSNACLLFSGSALGYPCVLTSPRTLDQLEDSLSVMNKDPLSSKTLREILRLFSL
jgi:aryl-alcohol dehydrogenase-like predicted oxidoreductase